MPKNKNCNQADVLNAECGACYWTRRSSKSDMPKHVTPMHNYTSNNILNHTN